MAGTKEQSFALAKLYVSLYEQKYRRRPKDFNLYRDRTGFEAVIKDLGKPRAQELLERYMALERGAPSGGHPCSYFFFNYEKLNARLIEEEEDRKNAPKEFKETEDRVRQWRKEHSGN